MKNTQILYETLIKLKSKNRHIRFRIIIIPSICMYGIWLNLFSCHPSIDFLLR